MCDKGSLAWAMLQTMRAVAREGALSLNRRSALEAHCLDALADYLPPLVDLMRSDSRHNEELETRADALPTSLERCLLTATACALRDPERSRQLLARSLAQPLASRAEDLVTAMACALEDQCRRRQRLAQGGVRPIQARVH